MRKYDLDVPAQTMGVLDAPEIRDGRARFREMFCSTLRDSPNPKQRTCEELLHRLSDETPSAASPITLPPRDTRLRFVFVTGLFNDCASAVALPFETAVPRLQSLGYEAEIFVASGRSSSAHNADDLAAFVSKAGSSDQRLVLVGYSKGAVDILEFLVAYPELVPRVRAVVSVAGAINGSALADTAYGPYDRSLKSISVPGCDAGDGGAVDSLRRPRRLNWLAEHSLPQSVRYFSVVAFTRSDSVAGPLRPFAAALAEIDPHNDGQLLFYDQVIPGATLLGYADADHWGIAVPIEEKRPMLATFVTGHNWFPRDALIEAIALYLSEQLEREPEGQ